MWCSSVPAKLHFEKHVIITMIMNPAANNSCDFEFCGTRMHQVITNMMSTQYSQQGLFLEEYYIWSFFRLASFISDMDKRNSKLSNLPVPLKYYRSRGQINLYVLLVVQNILSWTKSSHVTHEVLTWGVNCRLTFSIGSRNSPVSTASTGEAPLAYSANSGLGLWTI